jgi:hypothetical protein
MASPEVSAAWEKSSRLEVDRTKPSGKKTKKAADRSCDLPLPPWPE